MDKINFQSVKELSTTSIAQKLVIIDDIKKACEISLSSHLMVEGFLFGLILQGSADIVVDDQHYKLERGDVFGCNPRNILEHSMLRIDLEVIGVFASPDYTLNIISNLPIDWSFMMLDKTHETMHLSDQQMEHFINHANLLREKIEAEDSPHKEQSIHLLLQSWALEMFDLREKNQKNKPYTPIYGPTEKLLQRFLQMLSESRQLNKPYLNVNEYANRLNVTPKYFSQVCKKSLGKTAGELIAEDIIRTAETLLRENNLSIKQIADRLGFANQSHFGAFFRRKADGISPQKFRAEHSIPK